MGQLLNREDVLKILEREMPTLQVKFGVVRLALYGSYARGKPKTRSDVDLIVELSHPLGLEFVSLADHLEELLGRKVDLTTFETVRLSRGHPRRGRIVEAVEETLIDVRPAT